MPDKKTCFVVMGFGKKTDYQTGRVLDLDKSYQYIIKPAAQNAGLDCKRADEIVHSGTIDVPMYEMLLTADVVVADVSTSNANAFYELGVRHALRPFTTITIAEDKMVFPFDVSHIAIRRYTHLGDGIDFGEVMRMQAVLSDALAKMAQTPSDDSPVYTFLRGLKPPMLEIAKAVAAVAPSMTTTYGMPPPPPAPTQSGSERSFSVGPTSPGNSDTGAGKPDENKQQPSGPTISDLMQEAKTAIGASDFKTARQKLLAARALAPKDAWVAQKLAFATYKSEFPSPLQALREGLAILSELDPDGSTDSETLGLWGAIHKRLWELAGDPKDLDAAIASHAKAFSLRKDYWNGINLAFLYNDRASQEQGDEAVADRVTAQRIRRQVVELCEPLLENQTTSLTDRYWLVATLAEAYLGLGDQAKSQKLLQDAQGLQPAEWMVNSTASQLRRLAGML